MTMERADAVVQYYAVMADVAYLVDDLRRLIRVWRGYRTDDLGHVRHAFTLCAEQLERILDDSAVAQRVKEEQ